MARRTWLRATVLALALPSVPLLQLWDVLIALVLDAQTQEAGEAPPEDGSTDDRSAALDPWG